MPIGAPSGNAGHFQPPLPGQGVAASAIREEMDLGTTIAGYYSQLHARAPLYADLDQPGALNTMAGVRFHEQLRALNDKAMSLLSEHRGDAGKAAAANLNIFMLELATGGLSDKERNYFYSRPFKAEFEQMVAKADRAAPEDRDAAMTQLEVLGTMVRDPRKFLLRITADTIAKGFADAFNQEVARDAVRSNYEVA